MKKNKEFKFWTSVEDQILKNAYDASSSIKEAAKIAENKMKKRTYLAIYTRLCNSYGAKRKRVSVNNEVNLPESTKIELKGVNITIDNKKITIWR